MSQFEDIFGSESTNQLVQLEATKAPQQVAMAQSDDLMDPAGPKRKRSAAAAEEEEDREEKGLRVVRYCFTYNNPTVTGEEFHDFLMSKRDIIGSVFQLEEGEDGTPHFQGYFELKVKKTTSATHKMLAPHKMTLLHAKGTKEQNMGYCTKEDTHKEGPWVYGTCESAKAGNQGERNDTTAYAELVLEEGGVTKKVIEQFKGHTMRFGKHADDLVARANALEEEEKEMAFWAEQVRKVDAGEVAEGQVQRHLELYFGPSGAGKTTIVKMEVMGRQKNKMYTKACGNKWWCGYNGEKDVLMDEFRGDTFGTLEEFNSMTNLGVCRLERKGGQVTMCADRMHFTTNAHPSMWWKKAGGGHFCWKDARFRAVSRRFAKVHWWNDELEKVTLINPGKDDGTAEWKANNTKWVMFWEWKSGALRTGFPMEPDANDWFTLPWWNTD